MKVLLLTDNLLTRTNLENVIKNAGCGVIADQDGVRPDLIVVDLTTGDALEKIRDWSARSPAPEIIAFGPHVDGDSFKNARKAGATSLAARSKIADKLLEHLNAR